MRKKYIIAVFVLIIIAVFYLNNIYLPISGTVVDAENGQPIEEVIVMAQWTRTHGFGESYHTLYKITETETDKYGRFKISGVYNPFVDKPTLVLYRSGYIAWRNDIIFPVFDKRADYSVWMNDYIYKMKGFKDNFSRENHQMFIGHGIMISGLNLVPMFHKALNSE